MNQEAYIRRDAAETIEERIQEITQGVLIVGSVAYNPLAVSAASDLDMVAVLNFSGDYIDALYRRLRLPAEHSIVRHAREQTINTFSIVWDAGFEIGLHVWNTTAFEHVIRLDGHNIVFARDSWNRNFTSTALSETRWNLHGEAKEFAKPSTRLDGGKAVQFCPYYEDEHDFYPGEQPAPRSCRAKPKRRCHHTRHQNLSRNVATKACPEIR